MSLRKFVEATLHGRDKRLVAKCNVQVKIYKDGLPAQLFFACIRKISGRETIFIHFLLDFAALHPHVTLM